MLFFYVRHGDPTYEPDALTPLGVRQAEAVAKRLALYGVDKIYASSSTRAAMTAQPTCEITKKEPELLDFAHEHLAWQEFSVEREDGKGRTWIFHTNKAKLLFNSKKIRELGDKWYNHPEFSEYDFEKGVNRVYRDADAFLANLGYEHIRHTGKYKVTKNNDQRVALFAHQGFGLAFLSCLLDIPYPMFSTHFDMCHTGVTVIEFKEIDGYAIPKILTLSDDSHIYREGLPTFYNSEIYF